MPNYKLILYRPFEKEFLHYEKNNKAISTWFLLPVPVFKLRCFLHYPHDFLPAPSAT